MDHDLVHAVLSEDWRAVQAPLEIAALLPVLETFGRRPRELTVAQLSDALEVVPLSALEQALLVGGAFTNINRMVDTFGSDLTEEQAPAVATLLATLQRTHGRKGKPREPYAGELPPCISALRTRLVGEAGDAPQDLRIAIEAAVVRDTGGDRPASELPAAVEDLVLTISRDAHQVTDAQFDLLKEAYSEEIIYEMVFAASGAATIARMEMAWKLLDLAR